MTVINRFAKTKKQNSVIVYIQDLFKESWREIFLLDTLSLDFLMYADKRFSKESEQAIFVEHLTRQGSTEDFIIEIPKQQFTEKLEGFFAEIIKKLPCFFEDIFEDEQDQIRLDHFFWLDKIS